MSIWLVMLFNHLILCWPLLLLPSVFPSITVFSNASVLCIRWPKYWSFSFSSRPSNEYSGLISFKINWFDLLAVQGTLKNLLQHHSSKASILPHYPPQISLSFPSHMLWLHALGPWKLDVAMWVALTCDVWAEVILVSATVTCSSLIRLWAKYGLLSVFLNKVLLEHSHTYLFMYYLWPLFHYNSKIK